MLGIASHRTRNTHTGGKGGRFPGKGVIFVQNELDPRIGYTVLGIIAVLVIGFFINHYEFGRSV